GHLAPAARHPYRIAVLDAEPEREVGVKLHKGARAGRTQQPDAPGLRARLVVREDPPGGEVVRVVRTDLLDRAAMLDRDEPGPAVGRGEAVREQPRRARPAGRTRPEHPVLGLDPVP